MQEILRFSSREFGSPKNQWEMKRYVSIFNPNLWLFEAVEQQQKHIDAHDRASAAFEANKIGDFERAIEEYSGAIKLNPTKLAYQASRAAVYISLENPKLALLDTEEILKQDPTNSQVFKPLPTKTTN